ncbi:acetyl-CoA carboxylase biotin carboxyl carrier protein subunit [Oscillibacter sp. GMB15532]|uniref:acetyl-CoA carboxylase biotin carboxyl carrier protein n=1 Tax=Oscillibacter sp. GMB15532 TaxID=3230022 RepID=UPI0034DEF631
MTNSEIFELMDRFEKSGILTMRVCVGGDELELSRAGTAATPDAAAAPASPAMSAPNPQEGPVIRAPLVGTFYAAPAPDRPPLVNSGDRVSKGQTVCLIEAMKMMSEVTAPCDCVIEEALVKNGDLLGFDAPIFRYREA